MNKHQAINNLEKIITRNHLIITLSLHTIFIALAICIGNVILHDVNKNRSYIKLLHLKIICHIPKKYVSIDNVLFCLPIDTRFNEEKFQKIIYLIISISLFAIIFVVRSATTLIFRSLSLWWRHVSLFK